MAKKKIAPGEKQNDEHNSRREFLKKAVYTTPTLIALGSLVKPKTVYAESAVPPPPFWMSPDDQGRRRR